MCKNILVLFLKWSFDDDGDDCTRTSSSGVDQIVEDEPHPLRGTLLYMDLSYYGVCRSEFKLVFQSYEHQNESACGLDYECIATDSQRS